MTNYLIMKPSLLGTILLAKISFDIKTELLKSMPEMDEWIIAGNKSESFLVIPNFYINCSFEMFSLNFTVPFSV